MNTEKSTVRKLSELKTGETAYITKVTGHGSFRKRISEMGFIKGKRVKVIKNAPLLDPIEYEVMDYYITLRRSEAALIEVISSEDFVGTAEENYNGIINGEILTKKINEKSKTINVALVGNPNSGKTTLYNFASGSRERVANYSGVTVESRTATFKVNDYTINIADLPGTYSITDYTPEEVFVREYITENRPDVVINVIDASNLERNLYLTTQLIDMNIKVLIALNMFDELEKSSARFDYNAMGKLIGIPIVPTVASKGEGLYELIKKLIELYEERVPGERHIHINYGNMIESSVKKLQKLIKENRTITDKFSSRYIALKLLENDTRTAELLKDCSNYQIILKASQEEIKLLENEYKENSSTIITDAKYGFISGALKETMIPGISEKMKVSNLIDLVLTHRLFGFPIFILFMWITFQATFSFGQYPMELIDLFISFLGNLLRDTLPAGALNDLIVDGVIGGVGGVIVFLPNILILFFFISFMEDSGYMARASFIMDKLMHRIGLHGKSFIPLLMGFGCNVPAIMATRTLENRKDRILTMLIIPFMSCSARLPVFVLMISAYFPSNQGLMLVGIYLIGVIIAVVVALIMNKIVFAKHDVPFVMELPPYRIPTLKNTMKQMWFKGEQYLRKIGTTILFASVLIWALGYFPRDIKYSVDYRKQIENIEKDSLIKETLKKEKINEIQLLINAEKIEKSYIGQIGHFLLPVINPLGFDWKIGVSILTGLAAKEILISTMGILYQVKDDEGAGLQNKIKEQVHTTGELKGTKVFSPLVAFCLMVFVLIYFPCVAVIATINREAGIRWAIFTVFYTTGLAWLITFVIYQTGSKLF